MGLMHMSGLSNDLPVNPYALMGLTSGYSMSFGALTSKLALLNGLANTSYDQNHVYDCTDDSIACQEQKRRAYGLAGVSAIATSAFADLRTHMATLEGLRAEAATADTPAERENIQIAIQTEQAWHQNLMGQIEAASMQATVQTQVDDQRAREATSQAYQRAIDSIPTAGN